jgi:hypothetical protein
MGELEAPQDELAQPAPPRRPLPYLRFRHGIRAFDGELDGEWIAMLTSCVMDERRDRWAACPCGGLEGWES